MSVSSAAISMLKGKTLYLLSHPDDSAGRCEPSPLTCNAAVNAKPRSCGGNPSISSTISLADAELGFEVPKRFKRSRPLQNKVSSSKKISCFLLRRSFDFRCLRGLGVLMFMSLC